MSMNERTKHRYQQGDIGAHLAKLHEHGLPRWINWRQLSQAIVCSIREKEPLYPPERLWVFGPDGEPRGTYLGDEGSVTVPILELGKLYQASLVHTHPPGKPPTVSDAWHAASAASPLLVVLEGETAHLVTIWHIRAPGAVGQLLEQEIAGGLKQALRRVKGRWQTVPLSQLETAIASLEHDWKQFLERVEGEG